MHFAVVGDLAEAIFIIHAIHASDQHRLATCCVADGLAEEVAARSIPVSLASSPEGALLDEQAETVIVSYANSETSIHMARQVSQADRHVLVVPPLDASTAFSYELHLLLDESQYSIIPLSGRWYLDPTSVERPLFVLDGLRQITAEGKLPESSQSDAAQIHAIDAFCGCELAYDRITGMDLSGTDGNLLSRTVTLASANPEEASLPPASFLFKADSDQQSDVTLKFNSASGESELATALPLPQHSLLAERSLGMVDRLASQLQNRAACEAGMAQFSNSLEISAGLAKSLRRRRTIDVYFDGISERGVFKTQMTAIGCGVLGYATFGLISYLIFAQLVAPPNWVLQVARGIWFAPLVIFLVAQLLLPIARERGRADESKSD